MTLCSVKQFWRVCDIATGYYRYVDIGALLHIFKISGAMWPSVQLKKLSKVVIP